MSALGKKLKARRIRDGLSLRDLGRLVGVSFSTLARIERGEGAPTEDVEARVLRWIHTGESTPAKERRGKAWHVMIEERITQLERELVEHLRDEHNVRIVEADECPR